MKLIALTIDNIRGIPHIEIKPNEENFIIFGPNGTGKSGIIDALDFLLTGNISRFKGEGSGEINLAKHGTHIEHEPSEAIVKATFKLGDDSRKVSLARTMSKSSIVEGNKPAVQPLIELASKGQHVLTRKELLNFITSQPKTRAETIQTLLNINEIEKVRTTLQSVKNELKRRYEAAQHTHAKESAEIAAFIKNPKFTEDSVFTFINQVRGQLGAPPIDKVDIESVKQNVHPPTVVEKNAKGVLPPLRGYIENLRNINDHEESTGILDCDQELRSLFRKIREQPSGIPALSQYELVKKGIDLINESGNCPLCDSYFPPGELRVLLQSKLSLARETKDLLDHVDQLRERLAKHGQYIDANLRHILDYLVASEIQNEYSELSAWQTSLQKFLKTINLPLESLIDLPLEEIIIAPLFAYGDFLKDLNKIEKHLGENVPKITPEQEAWDNLTIIEQDLRRYIQAKEQLHSSELHYHRAEMVYNSFIAARDEVLTRLYEDISSRFVELYKKIHESDEDSFDANLRPSGAGLKFEVNFLDYGFFPPHALHSEGHQDSMGLCIFLALYEQLNKGLIDFVILDDVVMSIDANHRRAVSGILAREFPGVQFIITTHDKTWKNQLKADGVVKSKNILELYKWSINEGPAVNTITDIWERIDAALEKGDVPSAAATLRRGLEEFFTEVSERIEAKVPLKTNAQWDFGEVVNASMGKYKTLIKTARTSADSWDRKDLVTKFAQIEQYRKKIVSDTKSEEWAINPNVHYNKWANFTPDDFVPVVKAFQNLQKLFICDQCGSTIFVEKSDFKETAVRCQCNDLNWNLLKR
ncbi:AAA family ATPase [Methanoculleus sp. YWC-01]|uniref:AAA family ATPase n=1 Tax=Methanoculleus nereidis TaxID=2735141 RepID=A0ABU3Z399_9EURY|nr:AAA family ATPase [Methanoculleus sp. YWC-01]MDV4343296.1 AAA family ATPase [Methanoculleus sp. YWC-01]